MMGASLTDHSFGSLPMSSTPVRSSSGCSGRESPA